MGRKMGFAWPWCAVVPTYFLSVRQSEVNSNQCRLSGYTIFIILFELHEERGVVLFSALKIR
jgi:hypothetical protein